MNTTEIYRPPAQATGTTATTPDLLGLFNTMSGFTSAWTPMLDERRAELIEELVRWSADPDGADWEYLDSLS